MLSEAGRERQGSIETPLTAGLIVGYWTILYRCLDRGKHIYYACLCSCGKIFEVEKTSINRGLSKRCRSCAAQNSNRQRASRNA